MDCQILISVDQHRASEIEEVFMGLHKIELKWV